MMNDNSEVFWDENSARYKAFFENSPDGFLITVPDGNILAASPSACAMFQMTEAEIVNVGRFGIVDLSDPNLHRLIEERKKNGKARGEVVFLRKDGSKFKGEVTSSIFTDVNGQLRTSMIIRDISERKKVEEDLKASSEHLQRTLNELQKIMDASIDIICSISSDGRFVSINAAIEKILGYSPEEVIGRSYTDIIFPEDTERAKKMAEEIYKGNKCFLFENKYIHKNGHLVPLLWSAIWHDGDKLLYCIAKDATEKKEYEISLEREKKRMYDLFEQAPSCIGVLKGPDHIFELANPLYLELAGKKNIIGKSVRAVFPEIEDQGFFTLLDEVFRTGKPFVAKEMPIRIDRNNSGTLTEYYLNFIFQAFHNVKGETEGIYFFGIDVTEQVVSRKKIENNERRFQALIEKSKDVITLANKEGIVKYTSPSFEVLLGYKNIDCVSVPFFNFIYLDDLEVFKSHYSSVNIIHGDSVQAQFRMLSKSGGLLWCEGTITNMLNESGINAIVLNFRDITEMKIKEQERETMVRNLRHHSKNLEQFSYIISHNLRGPVANILGLANVLKTEISESDRQQTQSFLFSAVQKMDDTLKDLNKILSVKAALAEQKEEVFFNTTLKDVSFSIENVIASTGAVILSNFSEVEKINTVKGFLHSIFYNLILNSIKYRKQDLAPIIEVRSESLDAGMVRIIFKDNGSGIDLSMYGDQIFGLHKRFHLNIEGRGLGLFMIKTQVESLGGKISVHSSVGEGAAFIVDLPN